jgi:pilus assembly protein CpaB
MTALIISAGCSYFVYRLVQARVVTSVPKGTRVIVAANDIKIGTILKASDLTGSDIYGTVPKGVFVKADDLIGRGVVSNIYAGEPVLENRLAALGSGGGLAATIKPGMRACAIKVDEVVGVAGFVTPGSHVDVLISGTPPGNASAEIGTKVKTLLQNIEVLSAGQDIQQDSEGKPKTVQVVNLLVTPQDAEALSLASNQARIQLVLRNPLDTDVAKTTGLAMGHLYADSNPPPRVVAAPRVTEAKPANPSFVVEVLNGSKRTEEKFASSEKKQ